MKNVNIFQQTHVSKQEYISMIIALEMLFQGPHENLSKTKLNC